MGFKHKPVSGSGSKGKKKKEKEKEEKVDVDLALIPPSHRLQLNLNLAQEQIFYDFHRLIFFVQAMFSLDGEKILGKPVASKGQVPAILIEVYHGGKCLQILLEKESLYVGAFSVYGKWYTVKGSKLNLKDSQEIWIPVGYEAKGVRYEVGICLIREAVDGLHSSDIEDWATHYYALCMNFSEASRFPMIQRLFSMKKMKHGRLSLVGFNYWCVNNWSKLSKVWKLYARYGVWDIEGKLPNSSTTVELWNMIALIKNKPISEKIAKLESKITNLVVFDPSIK